MTNNEVSVEFQGLEVLTDNSKQPILELVKSIEDVPFSDIRVNQKTSKEEKDRAYAQFLQDYEKF